MPIRNGNYETRSSDDVFETLVSSLLDEYEDANPRNRASLVNAILVATATTVAQNQEQSLQEVYRAAYIVDASDEELTKKAQNLGVIRKDSVRATGVVTFGRDTDASSDYVIPEGTRVETLERDPIQFETTEQVTLAQGTRNVDANIRAVTGGSEGNVGTGAISVLTSPPTGVESVTNNDPIGDPTITDTNGDPLVEGRDRETDSELRTRVLETDATDIGPSADGIDLALNSVTGVTSKYVQTNQTDTVVNGIDPYHTEVVVLGGDTLEIAQALTDVMSVTSLYRLQGGVNGTKESTTIYIQLLDENVTIPITRPPKLTFDLTVDVVHDGSYEGDVAVKDEIVEYVGGTRADDSTTTGIGIGVNVLLNEIENRVEDVQGVDYADVTLIDTDGDTNDDSSTDSDGVPILSVAASEVPRVDADDITLNTTAR
jgi:uncharacterized phage protein gp47/JayE